MSLWWVVGCLVFVFFFYQILSLNTFCQSQASSAPPLSGFPLISRGSPGCPCPLPLGALSLLQTHPTLSLFTSLLKLASSLALTARLCCKDSRLGFATLPVTRLRKAGRRARCRAARVSLPVKYIYINDIFLLVLFSSDCAVSTHPSEAIIQLKVPRKAIRDG